MTRRLKYISFNFLLLICTLSCKHEIVTPIDLSHNYYPTNIGHWVTYDVDSTYYNDFTGTVITYHYKIKELIASTYLDLQNRPTQRIERYKCTDSTAWNLAEVWASNLTTTTAERVEENIRFIKLSFPPVEGKTWNGNAYNTLGELDYVYNNINEPYTINGSTFDSTVTVIQECDTNNLVYYKYMTEMYAKNIGLIFKQVDTLQKLTLPYDYTRGVNCIYRINSYGN